MTGRNGLRTIGEYFGVIRSAIYSSVSDVVHVQKVLLDQWKLRTLLCANDQIVYDFDDAIYASPPWKKSPNVERRERLEKTLETVSHTIVGSEPLAEYANQFCDNVYILPTALPRDQYQPYWGQEIDNNKKTVIGWIGNPENLWYLRRIEQPLREILSSCDSVELHVITSDDRPFTPLEDRIGTDVKYQSWALERELDLLNKVDIGIRPLTDDEWTRGKGGYTSVIQCMGLGIPVVVSPVGMLSDVVEHKGCGYHATSNSEWKLYLQLLANDTGLRQTMGQQAVERVGEERFWIDQRIDDMVSIYESIIT